jgi:hypothetical protein
MWEVNIGSKLPTMIEWYDKIVQVKIKLITSIFILIKQFQMIVCIYYAFEEHQ